MNWYVKDWAELDREELYDLLILRTAVFVVEQSCPYQEADGRDRRAWRKSSCITMRSLDTWE